MNEEQKALRWKYLFGKTILERGKQYYNRGRVQELRQEGSHFAASVIGSCAYEVELQVKQGGQPIMSCECPYAAGGNYCKHMAALLFAVEDMGLPVDGKKKAVSGRKSTVKKKALPAPKKRIRPFQDDTPDAQDQASREYRYFDLNHMTKDLVFYNVTCDQAKEMVDKGTVTMSSVEFSYFDEYGYYNQRMMGIVRGNVVIRNIETEIRINFDRERILRAMCYMPGCYRSYDYEYSYGNKELCVHETALLFLLDQYLKEKNPGDSTDWNAAQLLRAYHGHRLHQRKEFLDDETAGEDESAAPCVLAHLEPRLENNGDGLRVSFRVGKEKLYVVKNLNRLVENVKEHKIMPLGKKGELDFGIAQFDERSQRYFDFISENVDEEAFRHQMARNAYRDYDAANMDIKGSIQLYGRRMDQFYDAVRGQKIAYKSYAVNSGEQVRFEEKEPKFELSIAKDIDRTGQFHGVCLTGKMPEFLEGAKYFYYMENDAGDSVICRMQQERVAELKPLLQLAVDGEVSMQIGRKNLANFYHSVLPVLRQYATIREPEDGEIESYLPQEASYVFYLDADRRNVFCRASAVYGETECSLFDLVASSDALAENFRDRESEEDILYYVQHFFPQVDMEKGIFHCGEDEDTIYHVLESGVERLLALGEVQSTDRFRHLKIQSRAKVSVGVSVGSELMDLTILSDDIPQEELLEVLKGYQRKRKYYRLRNGDFLKLEDDKLEALSAMMETMHISAKEFVKGNMQVPVYRALYLDKMLEENEALYVHRDANFRRLVKDFKTVKESDYEVPEQLAGVMRNYQIYGHKWLRTLKSCGFGGILADDMGLGKTLQMISVILAEKPDIPSLIVCPASLVYNWQEEFARFAPELRVRVVAGTQAERKEILQTYDQWDVLVTSYDLLKRDVGEYEELHFAYQVIDEAQYIKNHTTAAAKSVKVIKSRARYALTGTPIENRLSELWSIFDYLMPGFLYGYDVFKKELESPIAKNQDETAKERLKKMVTPFILRRLKKDVLKDLPDKMEEVRYARFEGEQQRIYDGQVVHMQEILRGQSDENFNKNKLQILSELTRIRQICCDPGLMLEDYHGGSAKRQACMDLVESAIEGEHKILIFSQFTSMLEMLEADLAERNISYYKIIGSTPKEQRLELVREFNKDATPVFLISLKAGGTGLNLTGADVVIHYDPWWNVAAQNQATDRAHRIGQKKVVSVYKLIVKDSIEEKILKLQEMKKSLADEILSGEMGGLMNMSRDDLLDLLN